MYSLQALIHWRPEQGAGDACVVCSTGGLEKFARQKKREQRPAAAVVMFQEDEPCGHALLPLLHTLGTNTQMFSFSY